MGSVWVKLLFGGCLHTYYDLPTCLNSGGYIALYEYCEHGMKLLLIYGGSSSLANDSSSEICCLLSRGSVHIRNTCCLIVHKFNFNFAALWHCSQHGDLICFLPLDATTDRVSTLADLRLTGKR